MKDDVLTLNVELPRLDPGIAPTSRRLLGRLRGRDCREISPRRVGRDPIRLGSPRLHTGPSARAAFAAMRSGSRSRSVKLVQSQLETRHERLEEVTHFGEPETFDARGPR